MPPWAIAAAIGGGRALWGAISGNQKKQRTKGFIEENYRLAKKKLGTRQAGIRQQTTESMIARGILSNRGVAPRTPETQAAVIPKPEGGLLRNQAQQERQAAENARAADARAATLPSRDLSGAVDRDLSKEFRLEDKELELQRRQAHSENNARATSEILDSIMSGVSTGVGIYNAGQALSMANDPGMGGDPAGDGGGFVGPIDEAMGLDSMPGAYGIDPVDPLGAGMRDGTVIGGGRPNYSFNVG